MFNNVMSNDAATVLYLMLLERRIFVSRTIHRNYLRQHFIVSKVDITGVQMKSSSSWL
jgi:hypothetical protein